MNLQRRARLLTIHSWTGVTSALFIYFVCFTGTLSLFNQELTNWEQGDTRIPFTAEPADISNAYHSFLTDVDQRGAFPFAVVYYPSRFQPYYEVLAPFADDTTGARSEAVARWSPVDGSRLDDSKRTFIAWISNLHINLWSPPIIGRTLVGFAGLVLFITICVGVFLHRKIIAMMFLWRADRGPRLLTRDSHNVLGLWGLLFHVIIAFSGTILGLNSLLGIVFGTLAFGGDHHPHLEPYPENAQPASGVYAQPLSLDSIRQITLREVNTEPAIVVQFNWSDENALYRIYHETTNPMVRFGVLDINGHTGDVVATYPTPPGPGSRLFASVLPLHQGTYGGSWLKLVYAVLGLSLCMLTITGALMWLDRRNLEYTKQSLPPTLGWKLMNRLVVGVGAGLPLAVMSTLYLDQLNLFATASRDFWLGAALFSIWMACVVPAFIFNSQKHYAANLLTATGVLLVGAPLINTMTQGGAFLNFTEPTFTNVSVANISLACLGLLTLGGSRLLTGKALLRRKPAIA